MRHPQSFASLRLSRLWLAGLVLLVATSGCTIGTDFWRQCACVRSMYVGATDLAGCWEGCWRSDESGHKGHLRAVITRCSGDVYHVRFHATFFKFLSYEYEVDMRATPSENGYVLSGQKDLGKLAGGMYYYTGHVTGDDFVSNYRSCKDYGVFVMRRTRCGSCCK